MSFQMKVKKFTSYSRFSAIKSRFSCQIFFIISSGTGTLAAISHFFSFFSNFFSDFFFDFFRFFFLLSLVPMVEDEGSYFSLASGDPRELPSEDSDPEWLMEEFDEVFCLSVSLFSASTGAFSAASLLDSGCSWMDVLSLYW